MGLYNRVTGNQTQWEELNEPEPFNSVELEQAFDGAYRSYTINGRSNSARIQVTTWIRFIKDEGPAGPGVAVQPLDELS